MLQCGDCAEQVARGSGAPRMPLTTKVGSPLGGNVAAQAGWSISFQLSTATGRSCLQSTRPAL